MSEKITRQIKSSLFVDYFGKDEIVGKENFLSLYNALHDTNYSLTDTNLKLREIDDTLYKTFQNDLSMEINGRIVVLIEHQSTINNNMPLRLLEYVTRIYTSIIPTKVRYYQDLYKIPTPEFLVFYNGKDDYPEYSELKLSEAFLEEQKIPTLELVVKVYNIKNECLPIVQKCDKIMEYTKFINFIYENADLKDELSCKNAINEAKKKGLLPNYLERKITEVINMLTAEYDYDLDIQAKQEEAYRHGVQTGIKTGIQQGINQGVRQKALEDAVLMVKVFNIPINLVCQKMNIQQSELQNLL